MLSLRLLQQALQLQGIVSSQEKSIPARGCRKDGRDGEI